MDDKELTCALVIGFIIGALLVRFILTMVVVS